MGESTFPNPHDKDIRQVEEGLGKRAVYDSTNQAWKLPTGKNAAIGEWIWVNGQIGQATAAIVGGTDAIVEGTNWTEDTDGALNALNSKIMQPDVDTSITGITLRRIGRIVFIECAMNDITLSAWGVLATLPSGYRPIVELNLFDYYGRKRFTLNPNGVLQAAEAISNSPVRIFTSFVCAI